MPKPGPPRRFFYFLCPAADCGAILETENPTPAELGTCSACGAVLRFTENLRVEIVGRVANIQATTDD